VWDDFVFEVEIVEYEGVRCVGEVPGPIGEAADAKGGYPYLDILENRVEWKGTTKFEVGTNWMRWTKAFGVALDPFRAEGWAATLEAATPLCPFSFSLPLPAGRASWEFAPAIAPFGSSSGLADCGELGELFYTRRQQNGQTRPRDATHA
jgi:hypothetical protein